MYGQPEDSLNREVISMIERSMKKYADNQMRFLEGLSSRLSQLELYCYNLDTSVGEMRSDLVHHNREADTKLKSMDKHIQEVHRAVQILRDKQELAETQKEINLQLAQKESCPQEQEKSSRPASETKNTEDGPEMHYQQLALALPHQVAPQPVPPSTTTEQRQQQQPVTLTAEAAQLTSQTMTQQPPYYHLPAQLPNPAAQPQPAQSSYVPADSQYPAPQMAPNPSQGQANQPPQVHQLPQYQQQWSQSVPQPPAQMRGPQSAVYPAYMQSQPPNPPQQEQMTSSMPMQVPVPGIPQQGIGRVEVPLPFGYAGRGSPLQTQPPPHPMKGGNGYTAPGTPPTASSSGSYMIYNGEGTQPHHPPPTHFSQNSYPPASAPLHNPHTQPPTSSGHIIRGSSSSPPQLVRNPPNYSDLVDKLVNMGYRGDHVVSVIQRLEESGQAVDFNAVLDRLNGHSTGGSQRSW